MDPVSKEEVREALHRLSLSILGLKQGWSSPDITRHIDLDVGVLYRALQQSFLAAEPAPSPEVAEETTEPALAVPVKKSKEKSDG